MMVLNRTTIEKGGHVDIASEIRAEAARQHLSQRKLAELMGAPRTTVNKKIIGERKITGVDLESFSQALNVPAWELVRRAEEAAEKKAS
nr:MAG TPA: helix-turn-helix domain protein [Caudoviricetes sp.]